jgi:translin
MNIESLVFTCVEQIDSSHRAREEAISISRVLIRQCANTIRATHRSEYEEAAAMLHEAGATAEKLRSVVVHQPHISMAGYTQDALKEYAEAALVYAFLTGGELPSAETLHVEAAAFLNGLAEAASELRRAILDRLRRNEVHQSEALLAVIDEVYSYLMTVDYPDALTGGLRRSTDALRGVLERTRGDVTAAIRQERLMAVLAAFEQRTMGSEE